MHFDFRGFRGGRMRRCRGLVDAAGRLRPDLPLHYLFKDGLSFVNGLANLYQRHRRCFPHDFVPDALDLAGPSFRCA
jgi:hypothetical protein